METLIIAGGEINIEDLKNYCKAHFRANYNRC